VSAPLSPSRSFGHWPARLIRAPRFMPTVYRLPVKEHAGDLTPEDIETLLAERELERRNP
jgi:hypothetical protein